MLQSKILLIIIVITTIIVSIIISIVAIIIAIVIAIVVIIVINIDKRTTAERKYKSTTAWETLVGSSTKAACAAVPLGSRHTPLHEHGA